MFRVRAGGIVVSRVQKMPAAVGGDGLHLRAPTVEPLPKNHSGSRLGPGFPATHRRFHLPLLPSGPDGVHRLLLYGTQPSTLLTCPRIPVAKPAGGNSTPVERIPGYRAPLTPHLAHIGSGADVDRNGLRRRRPPVNVLSRNRLQIWWSRSGSNRRPQRCERCALPTELLPHIFSRVYNNAFRPFCQVFFAVVKIRPLGAGFSERDAGTQVQAGAEGDIVVIPASRRSHPPAKIKHPGMIAARKQHKFGERLEGQVG